MAGRKHEVLMFLKKFSLCGKHLCEAEMQGVGAFLLRGEFAGTDTSTFGKKAARLSTRARMEGDCAWNTEDQLRCVLITVHQGGVR